ncbi:hypothetical protein ACQKP5_01395 [Pseudomonas vancouverensis]|uniref:hypothetical protein n=1 Tax=Pseudomonas vancouverensis TaxID=95300 RepID=UPI003D01325B
MQQAQFVPWMCGALLTCLILALIFSPQFRNDMLKSNKDQTKVLGISVKGTVMLALSTVLVGGMIYPIPQSTECIGYIHELKAQINDKYRNEIEHAGKQNLPRLEDAIDAMKAAIDEIESACN